MKDEEEDNIQNENDQIQNDDANQEEIQEVAAKNFEGEHFYETEEDPEETITKVTGMYKDWFLDYASYVILERAVPAIEDA